MKLSNDQVQLLIDIVTEYVSGDRGLYNVNMEDAGDLEQHLRDNM